MAVDKSLKFLNNGEPLAFEAGFAQHPQEGNAFFVGDCQHIVITVVGTGTIFVHGSAQEAPPDFSATSTINNSHALITVKDYSVANTFYNGATGIVASNETVIVQLDTKALTWVGFQRNDGAETAGVIITEADNG